MVSRWLSIYLAVALNHIMKQNFNLDKDHYIYYRDIVPLTFDGSYSNNLSFFESVGYPLPTDSDIEEFLYIHYNAYMINMLNEFTEETDSVNKKYLPLFYNVGVIFNQYNNELADQAHELVFELTSEDPYNEYRVLIEGSTEDSIIEERIVNGYKEDEAVQEQNEANADKANDETSNPFEWNPGIREAFELDMLERGNVKSMDELIYKDGYIAGENNDQGFFEVYTILENGEEHHIGTVNV